MRMHSEMTKGKKKMSEHPERIGRHKVYTGAVINVYQDDIQLPDGRVEKWDFVEHPMGAACVVPVTKEGKIVLVRQYRPTLDRYTLELPAGKRDSLTEDTLITAQRELSEETGYTTDNWSKLLALKTTVAFCNEFVDVYLAQDVEKTSGQHLDPDEAIEIKEYDPDWIKEQMYAGKIQDGKTVAGVMAYLAR